MRYPISMFYMVCYVLVIKRKRLRCLFMDCTFMIALAVLAEHAGIELRLVATAVDHALIVPVCQ